MVGICAVTRRVQEENGHARSNKGLKGSPPHQVRQLGDIRRNPSRLQAHLRIHKPVAGLPAEHFAPSGAPAEQTTETNASSSLQLTVPSPLTIRRPVLPGLPASSLVLPLRRIRFGFSGLVNIASSLAISAAILRASSLLSSLAAERRRRSVRLVCPQTYYGYGRDGAMHTVDYAAFRF